MRRLAWGLVGLAAALAGCKDTAPPGCRIAQSTTLPASPLTLTRDVTLQRAGAGLVLLGPDAQAMGMPAPVINASIPHGTCLSVVSSRTDFAVSVVQNGPPGEAVVWRAFELRDGGGHGSNVTLTLGHSVVGCISAAPTPRGYVLAYQNDDGTYFDDFNQQSSALNEDIVAGV